MTGLGNSQFRERAIVRNAQPEPLDDRAQVTAPREWVVLAGLGLALGALVAWVVFGSVERTLRAEGVLVVAAGRMDAVAFVAPREAWLLAAGMSARVAVESPAGTRVLPGRLTTIAPRAANPPGWLARLLPDTPLPGRGHLLRIAFENTPRPGLPGSALLILHDGTPCRIEVVVERTSPFTLLIRG